MKLVQEIYKDNIEFLKNIVHLAYETLDEYNSLWFNLIRPSNSLNPSSGRKYEEEKVDAIQKKALRFLSELHDLSRGDMSIRFDMYEIGRKLGYDSSETEYIVENLSRSELIRREKTSGKVTITPYGIMVMEGEINVGYAPVHS